MTRKTTLNTLLFLTLSAGICTEKANAQWSPIASMGAGAIDGCFSFSLHGKGYVGGGSDGSHFYEYDSSTNAWTLKGNAPANHIRGFAYSFAANGKGYAGCGDTTGGNNSCSDMWMYNDTTGLWSQKASFPGGNRDAMFGFVINDTAYVGGGFDPAGGEWNDFYKYNPFTDTWTPLAALSMGAVGFPVSFVIGNKGYLATGQVGSSESNGLWEYSPATDTWTSKASLPGVPRQAAFAFAVNNYGYVGGGMSNYDTSFTDMWRYNTISNTWTSVESFPSYYPAWASAFTIGNTAYVGASSHIDATHLYGTDSFKRYRGITNTTEINEVPVNNHIGIYPNPANDYITITGDIEPGSTILICDVTGRQAKAITGTRNGLFIGDLQAGIYIVRCINTSGTYTEKLIKR